LHYFPWQNESTARSAPIAVQGEFFSRGKSYGRLSRAKKFTNFQFNRRPTQRRVNLRRKKIKTTLSNNQREKQRTIDHTGKDKRSNERCGWQIFNIGLWSQNEAQLSLKKNTRKRNT